ncbi:MAG: NHL repeat-containing protein [Gemmatimonadota bacterium]
MGRRPQRASGARARAALLLALAAAAGGWLAPGAAPAQTAAPEYTSPEEQPGHSTLVAPPFAHTLGIHRARPLHLKLFLGDRTRFDDPQGVAAVKFASDDDPEAKSDDFQLTLFGVNSGRGEILYNSTMQTLAIYGRPGSGDGQFRTPHGIAATPDGRVYVADTGNRRVARLTWDPDARALRWAGSWPAGDPFDVAADARGQVYVADRATDGVLHFADPQAATVSAPSPVTGARWPLPPDVAKPRGLAVGDSLDRWYRPQVYRLYLVDQDGARLRAYDPEGMVLAETMPAAVDRPGGGPGAFRYVALDYQGNVYVTDPGADVLYKFTADLQPLATFPGSGAPDEALEEPRGVAVWKRFGQVFVAEREGAQYYFIGTDFTAEDTLPIRRDGEAQDWAFPLFLTEVASVTVTFLDAAGDTLGVAEPGVFGVGQQTIRWDDDAWTEGPADGWEQAASRIVIDARPTYSSRKRFSRVRTLPLIWNDSSSPVGPP